MSLQFMCPACRQPFAVALADAGTGKSCPHCNATATLPASPLSVGYVLEQFEICAALGSGRNGALFQARDLRSGALAVIRVPPDNLIGGRDNAGAFLDQLARLDTLAHPHVGRILFSGRIDQTCFYATEHLAGGSLSKRLQQGRLDESEMLRILEQLTAALGFLHEHQFVPLDLTPSKILFDDAGNAKWGDVLLARPILGGEETFASWTLHGTPAYISPEQARGRGEADVRSNLYSLGAIAFEMLTGHPPFVKPTDMDLLAAHIAEPVPQLKLLVAVTPETATMVEKLLAKEPSARFQTAAELLTAVRAPRSEKLAAPKYITLKHGPPRATPAAVTPAPAASAPVAPGAPPPVKQSRRGWLIGGAAVLVVLVVAVGLWLRGASSKPTVAVVTQPPVVTNAPAPVVKPITLLAKDAIRHGKNLKFEVGPGHENIGYWNYPREWIEWPLSVTRTGLFVITADIAATGSARFEISVGSSKVAAQAPVTGAYTNYQTVAVGRITLVTTGNTALVVKADAANWHPLNVRRITLTPAK